MIVINHMVKNENIIYLYYLLNYYLHPLRASQHKMFGVQRHRGSPSTDNINPFMMLVDALAGLQHTQSDSTNGFGGSQHTQSDSTNGFGRSRCAQSDSTNGFGGSRHTQPIMTPRDGKHGSDGFPATPGFGLIGEWESCTFQPVQLPVQHRHVQFSAPRQPVQPPVQRQPVQPPAPRQSVQSSVQHRPVQPPVQHRPVQPSAQYQSPVVDQPVPPYLAGRNNGRSIHPRDLPMYRERNEKAMEMWRDGRTLSCPYGQEHGY